MRNIARLVYVLHGLPIFADAEMSCWQRCVALAFSCIRSIVSFRLLSATMLHVPAHRNVSNPDGYSSCNRLGNLVNGTNYNTPHFAFFPTF